VQTGAPIGWVRASASVLIFQRACSARTQPRQAAFASSPASSRVAVTWPRPSPRLRPVREVLAQSNHFQHWDRLAPEWMRPSGAWLAERGAVGQLRPDVEQLLADPGTLAAAARLLLDLHFTPGLSAMICDQVGLDLAVLELSASPGVAVARRILRRPGGRRGGTACLWPTSAPCAGSTGRLAVIPWGSRRRTCAGTARMAQTWWPTAWRCARYITRFRPGRSGADHGPAHPCVQPVRGPQRRRPGSRSAGWTGAARAQARPAGRGARPHRLASPTGLQGGRRISRLAERLSSLRASPGNRPIP
jgi:hypothetical protein